MSPLFVAIEAGGTKFVVGVFDAAGATLERAQIDTSEPETTLKKCVEFIHGSIKKYGDISALGVAGFGPICVDNESPRYGGIVNSPKRNWSGINLKDYFSRHFSVPVVIDSDVNAAALAEHRNRDGQRNLIYVTVGTGVGVGVCINGKTLKGQLHPELGHIPCQLLPGDPPGRCDFHENCIEGLVSGASLKKRWNVPIKDLPGNSTIWASSGHYLAQLCAVATLAYSPYVIVVGGGVANSGHLYDPTRRSYKKIMGNYLPDFCFPQGIDQMIQEPSLNDAPGLVGAFHLAKDYYHDNI